jgi:catechol 2,3-dioxygenase
MPDGMKIGPPTLRVRDLDGVLDFYENIFGLVIDRRIDDHDDLETVELRVKAGANNSDPLLILKHDPNAKPVPNNFAGLFHFAILVPDRKSLAIAYSSIEQSQVQFDGFADHLVSESLYLNDPERNGIEIYRDKPSNEWTRDSKGHVIMDTLPLDMKDLLAETFDNQKPPATFPNGARVGHIHLRVTDLERSVKFYSEKLGLDVSADWFAMGAMFLSAGGYHHHLGLNIWHSLAGTRHQTGDVGLDSFKINTPATSPACVHLHHSWTLQQ